MHIFVFAYFVMYICIMKGQRKNISSKPIVRIYHQEVILQDGHYPAFYLIIETIEGLPQRSYFYRIPESYKDDRLLGQMHERYCSYCPN